MKFSTTIICLLLIGWTVYAQKEDRNWIFGYKCGIDFNNANNPQIFEPQTSNFELSASISDSLGNLLLYIGTDSLDGIDSDIMGKNDVPIQNGNNIKTSISSARGVIIIPSYDKTKFMVFHTSYESYPFCTPSQQLCASLYYTLIDMKQNGGNGAVILKNVLILDESVEEGLSAVKHANGNDWWVIVHKNKTYDEINCSNRFYKFLVKDTLITGPFTQDVGSLHCNDLYPTGEPRFSPKGNYLSYVSALNMTIDIFCFNRCNGELTGLTSFTETEPYSSEFSPDERFLYVSSGFNSHIKDTSTLYQYDLKSADIADSKVKIWQEDDHRRTLGQLQLAPNGKIYVAIGTPGFGGGIPIVRDSFLRHISVINSPDSIGLACDFRLFDFYLGDSSLCYLNLPNIPNYGLGMLDICNATAGGDKSFCKDSFNGVFIGSNRAESASYLWRPSEGLDDSTSSNPFASPSTTTRYILFIRDESCHTREDTVLIEVTGCAQTESLHYFPTAFTPNGDGQNDLFYLISSETVLTELRIYNRWGELIHNTNTAWDGTYKGKTQPMGTYVYYAQIILRDGEHKKISGAVSILK